VVEQLFCKQLAVGSNPSAGSTNPSLVSSLDDYDLDRGDGRVRRFALIAIRHADDHGGEIETGLGINHPT
jgi:hypothetical protein